VQEAKKKIHSVSNGKLRADVIKLTGADDEGDPFIVKLFKNGKHHEPADYFTDDKGDAIGTAKMMVKEDLDEAMQDNYTVQFPELKKKVPVRARNSQEAIKKAAKRVGANWKTVKLGKVQKLGFGEEVEQVDELKKSTVKSYVSKAIKNRNVNKAHGMDHLDRSQASANVGDTKMSDSEFEKGNKRFAKADKRQSGINRAKKRYNEDVEQVDEAAPPKLKKASVKGSTASGVRGKHLKTYEITMMAERGGIMFRVKSSDGDISTVNAAALAKLL